jgi:hypothetical protein
MPVCVYSIPVCVCVCGAAPAPDPLRAPEAPKPHSLRHSQHRTAMATQQPSGAGSSAVAEDTEVEIIADKPVADPTADAARALSTCSTHRKKLRETKQRHGSPVWWSSLDVHVGQIGKREELCVFLSCKSCTSVFSANNTSRTGNDHVKVEDGRVVGCSGLKKTVHDHRG